MRFIVNIISIYIIIIITIVMVIIFLYTQYKYPGNYQIIICCFKGIYYQNNELTHIIIELTHSQIILENTVEIEPQSVALDFKNLSQYSSRSK